MMLHKINKSKLGSYCNRCKAWSNTADGLKGEPCSAISIIGRDWDFRYGCWIYLRLPFGLRLYLWEKKY